ncbi:MAG: glycosyltransferase [Acidimicrobiaceae bacterium]|nr:glycosyltransferase [Acidimicrobiaceae bacterium]
MQAKRGSGAGSAHTDAPTVVPALVTVAAVVVNYEAGEALLECVASLRAAGVSEIVVVDNGSRDGSLAELAAADPIVRLIPNGRNLGYGQAVNRGAAPLEAPYLLVCNPDLRLDPAAPARLAAVLEANSDVAIAAPLVLRPDGERYPSARAFPNYGTALAHALLAQFWPGNRWSRHYRRDAAGVDEQDVDWVSGACFLVRRCAFESVGGFDPRYFMYVEDLDLCWRLHRAAWRVRYVPSARVVHEQGRSTSRRPYRMLVAHHVSTWRFARRRAVGSERLLLVVIGPGIVARLVVALVREVISGRRSPSPLAVAGPVDCPRAAGVSDRVE